MAPRSEIIFLLTFCMWQPLFATNTDPVDNLKSDLSSFVILFDTTIIKMAEAKNAALRILEDISQYQDTIIQNYILVPFNGEGLQPEKITTRLNFCKAAIFGLQQEMLRGRKARTLDAIEKGLNLGLRKSLITVITDSQLRNSNATISRILSAIEATEARIMFLLDYERKKTDAVTEFSLISTASRGQIFTFESDKEDDTPKILHYFQQVLIDSLTSRMKNLTQYCETWTSPRPTTRVHLYWQKSDSGNVCENAIVGGKDEYNPGLTYIARVPVYSHGKKSMIPGKIVPSLKLAIVPNKGSEWGETSYEVLCGATARWVPSENWRSLPGAFPVDETNTLYICKAIHGSSTVPGKVHIDGGDCLIPFGRAELKKETYQVLFYETI